MKISPLFIKPISNSCIKNNNKLSFKKSMDCDSFESSKYCYMESASVVITPQRQKQLEDFAQKYGIKIDDISLLNQVFVYNTEGNLFFAHSSTHQRLEYIGDRVISLCIAKMVSDSNIHYQEGTLTRFNQAISSNENLAKFAKKLELEKFVYLRENEDCTKHLADMFEALLGAIFISGGNEGFNKSYEFLKDNFSQEILNCDVEISNFEEKLAMYLENHGYDSSKIQYKYCTALNHQLSCIIEYNGKVIINYELEKSGKKTHKNSKDKARHKAFELAYDRVLNEGLEILN